MNRARPAVPLSTRKRMLLPCLAAVLPLWAAQPSQSATNFTVVGWNNLGMHCMDSDFSIFSILPPYNSIHAQVVQTIDGTRAGLLTDAAPFTCTYQAVADPLGSINRTSRGKGNFWDYSQPLYHATLAIDVGLPVAGPSSAMPGTNNTPQGMSFDPAYEWFASYGIPILPYDDAGTPQSYPMMKLSFSRGAAVLDTTDIVLPVSEEMDCKLCHLSGSGPAARPASGWTNDPDPAHDYRLNILRLHDERQSAFDNYAALLIASAYNPRGLAVTVVTDGTPILCARCHASEALPGTGVPGLPPLTAAVHTRHAAVVDPRNDYTLNAETNRQACYTCHPGSATRCLRGAMGKAVAADGTMAMQCQSCHGSMSDVGGTSRTGWLDEPNCQSCHVGSATNRFGRIRFTSTFDAPGHARAPAERIFATNLDTPPGHSLYRFSRGHGNLQCSACHGSTHAEYPSAHPNDNLQSIGTQGHEGPLAECQVCHGTQPSTIAGGPHGMHPAGQSWAANHSDALESARVGTGGCRACHGADYRGTELSRVAGTRSFSTGFGTRNFWRGYQVGCYNCHNGPSSEKSNPNRPPTVANATASTDSGVPVTIPLTASDPDGNPLALRIVSQSAHGTVALDLAQATYRPEPGFSGSDAFTFAAWDGAANSGLGTVTLTVSAVDADHDGIPDWWTQMNFGHAAALSSDASGPLDDPDGDGFPNGWEFVARTDPHDARDYVRIFAVQPGSNGVQMRVASHLGQRFQGQRRADLQAGSWSNFTGVFWGRTDSTPLVDTNAVASPVQFYRVRVLP